MRIELDIRDNLNLTFLTVKAEVLRAWFVKI